MLLSVIIPCFNVINYIDNCIDSILSSKNDQFEVIVIDDGSSDGSYEFLLEKYVSDKRIKIIRKKNGGLASVRNFGLRLAKGDYVIFIDGDDFIDRSSLDKVINALNLYRPELLIVNFMRVWDSGYIEVPKNIRNLKTSCKCFCANESLIAKLYDCAELYCWRLIFSRDKYKSINFPEGQNFEDINTIPKLLVQCETFYYLNVRLVNYRQREDSIVNTKSYKNVVDLVKSNSIDPSFFRNCSENDKISVSAFGLRVFLWSTMDAIHSKLDNSIYDKIFDSYTNNIYVDKRKALRKLKTISKDEYSKVYILSISKFMYILICSMCSRYNVFLKIFNRFCRFFKIIL